MSYPRRKLDLNMLILESKSCEAMEAAAKRNNPAWDFSLFEAIHFGTLETPNEDEQYETFRVMSQAEEALNALDEEHPFLLPLESGTHYAWELFVELPRIGGSKSTRQFWNRIARSMSDIALPMDTDAFVDEYSKALEALLVNATDMGDRFYLSELDYGGWSGGIISKDFLVEGLKMLASKLKGPLCERKKEVTEPEEPKESEETKESEKSMEPEVIEPALEQFLEADDEDEMVIEGFFDTKEETI